MEQNCFPNEALAIDLVNFANRTGLDDDI